MRGCLKILQYSEMEYNCVRKITEGLFRKHSALWQHKWKSNNNVKILYTWFGGQLNFEALGFSLSSLQLVNPALFLTFSIHTVQMYAPFKDYLVVFDSFYITLKPFLRSFTLQLDRKKIPPRTYQLFLLVLYHVLVFSF